jgi:hypothetical protein
MVRFFVLLCLIAVPVNAQTLRDIQGEYISSLSENIYTGYSKKQSLVREKSGKTWTISSSQILDIREGSTVRVRGKQKSDSEISVSALGESITVVSTSAASSQLVGATSVITMMVNFQNASQSCSLSQVENTVFNNGNSVDNIYREGSHGRMSIVGPIYANVNVPSDFNLDGCDGNYFVSLGETIDQAARQQGIPVDNYTYRNYTIPDNHCGWIGIAVWGYTNYRRGFSKGGSCADASVHAHELGHLFGMGHSRGFDGPYPEYGDFSDTMGIGGFTRTFNAPHREQMGWLPASEILSVASAGNYRLSALEIDPLVGAGYSTIKFRDPNQATNYYFSFRKRQGIDSGMNSNYASRVNVHTFAGSGETSFIQSLGVGEFFENSAGSRVQVTAIDEFGADVSVDTSCVSSAPLVTLNPSTQYGGPGSRVQFTTTLRNNDNGFCPSRSLSLSSSADAGLSVSFNSNSVTVAPGGSVNVATYVDLASTVTSDSNFQVSAGGITASGTVRIDSSAPTAPVLSGSATKNGNLNLNWSASQDNVGIARYLIYRNGVLLSQISGLSFTDRPATSGTYSYYVIAVDVSNLSSPQSNTVSIAFTAKGKGGRK